MIFDLTSLGIIDRFVSEISFDEIIKREIENDFTSSYIVKIYELSDDQFLDFIKKYGSYYFYNVEDKLVNLHSSSWSLLQFSQNLKTFFRNDRDSLKFFLSCFFIQRQYLEEIDKIVEETLSDLKDELSFNQFKDAYIFEFKNLIENYALKKEEV